MEKYKASLYNILIEEKKDVVILYNCYSGGIVQLEKDVFEAMQKPNFELDSIAYGEQLLENGYIVNEKIDEFYRAKIQIEKNINCELFDTVSYVIAPTLNCNLRCNYCFQKEFRTENSEATLSKKVADAIIRYIVDSSKQIHNLKKIKVQWFGGEPMLCYKQIVEFSRILKKRLGERDIQYDASMITNGILLDEEKIKVLTQECNLRQVQITVDGNESTYCEKKNATGEQYERVIENIKTATFFVKTKVRINADKKNYSELKKLAISLFESKINKNNLSIHFAQLRDYSCNAEQSECYDDLEYWNSKIEFYDTLKKFGVATPQKILPSYSVTPFCGIVKGKNAVIDYNGNLYKCEHYIGDMTKVIGNVFDGLYYNDVYLKSILLSTDKRCEKCSIFPCCNYSQCVAMHAFAGQGTECNCFQKQYERLQCAVQHYIKDKNC